ncbi:hypothetical protein ACRYCC_27660 [Actinomadura scrupuli]|uniref:hypothetical protein n=1 Tax=Actinomadura scrupuli TaxID=559629 RepID=UPI003D96DA9C
MNVDACSCGASISAAVGFGAVEVVRDDDVEALEALFTGRFDHARCDAGCELGIRPTVVFQHGAADLAVVSAGDLAGAERLPETVRAALGAPTATVDQVDGVDVLKARVADTIRARIAEIAPALDFGTEHRSPGSERFFGGYSAADLEYLLKHWRVFTAPVWAALAVMDVVPSAAVEHGGEGGAAGRAEQGTPEERLNRFALLQSMVWISMLEAWARHDAPPNRTFEDDLRAYVDSVPLLGRSVALLEEQLEGQELPEDFTDLILRYQAEAVRASLCVRSNPTDSVASDWACAFLLLEVQMRSYEVADADSLLPRVLLGVDRVRRLTHPAALQGAVAVVYHETFEGGKLTEETKKAVAVVQEVLAAFGYPDSLASPMAFLQLKVPLDELADALLRVIAKGSGHDPHPWTSMVQPLVDARRGDDLDRVVEGLLAGAPDDAVREIRLWHAVRVSEMADSERVLAILHDAFGDAILPGDNAGDGEPLMLVVRALRQLDRRAEALRLLDRAEGQPVTDRNTAESLIALRARLVRETGSPMRALLVLEEAYRESRAPTPPLLESLSMTCSRLGLHAEAVRYGRESYRTAMTEPTRWNFARYAAQVMVVEAAAGATPSLDLLRVAQRVDLRADPQTVLLAALAALAGGLADLDWPAHEFLFEVGEYVDLVVAENAEEMSVVFLALLFDARLCDVYFTDRAAEAWWRVAGHLARYGKTSPEVALRLARYAILEQRPSRIRPLLKASLKNMLMLVGDVERFDVGAYAGGDLVPAVQALTDAALRHRPDRRRWRRGSRLSLADLRLIAEVGRGATARRLTAHGQSDLKDLLARRGLDDAVAARLAPRTGRLGVLEWVAGTDDVSALITTVDHRGKVSGELVPMPDLDLRALANRLRYRLANWHAGRRGDPFGAPGWETLGDWAHHLIERHVGSGDHLVVIPHRLFPQLPWHVLIARAGPTASYEPSWAAVLSSIADPPLRPHHWREGVAVVPRVADPPAVTEAMQRFLDDMSPRADSAVTCLGVDCDRAALSRMLESVEVASVLCHGFTSSDDEAIALMIAADGALPLAHAVAANSTAGRRHRFGWRESGALARTPKVLFSVACSSATTHVVGAGEHVGFYNAMRSIGLRAFVAPQWDVVAADVLRVASRATNLFMAGDTGLAVCLATAADEAMAAGTPEWSARSLILNGDWR